MQASRLPAFQLERDVIHLGKLSGRVLAQTALSVHQQPARGPHARLSCAATGKGFGPQHRAQPQPQLLTKDLVAPEQFAEHKAMLERMAYTSNSYQDLAAWIRSNEQEIIQNPNLAVLAMIRAVDLLSTLSDLDSLGDDQARFQMLLLSQ
eukprot:1158166-Pelagomonas_calceolata.AAC.9